MHNGFYDDDLKFVHLNTFGLCRRCHLRPPGDIIPFATRLTANLRVCAISYPTMEELVEVYSQMAGAALTNPIHG